ncbi:MAG: sn-glycerol-3-phosphate ABC transporter ATP-binding protein UgpC [Pseudomonadota bacterium]
MTEIILQNIHKSYGDAQVIHGINLNLKSGEFIVFVGPSGCGKSTLLRIIAGLEQVSEGDILIDGARVNHIPASQRGLAMVFQSYALYPHMTVYKNMAFGLENSDMLREEIERRVHHAADLLQITQLLQRKPKALSGGQRQRVAIGRAIVREPKAFLLDEPLSNLDAELRVTMRRELASLHDSVASTMIYVTHDQVEAMTLADTIVVLHAGRISQVGTPLALYNTPQNTFVAGFIGSPRMNLLQGRLVREAEKVSIHLASSVFSIQGIDQSVNTQEVTVGIRPEHIDILSDKAKNADLTITVDLIEQLGGETYLYGQSEDGQSLTVHQPGQLTIQAGDRLDLGFRRDHLHLFDGDGAVICNGTRRVS